jgi:hypothetical protein
MCFLCCCSTLLAYNDQQTVAKLLAGLLAC